MEKKSESTIAITFSFLPLTQNKKLILNKMADEFGLLYNIAAKRLKSFNNIKQFSARRPLGELRKELTTTLHSKIAEEAVEYARSNYQTTITNRNKYKNKLESKIKRLQKQKESAKKPSKISNIQSKIDKWTRRLNDEPSLPELNAKIIRIHNKVWKFEIKKDTVYVVIPVEKIGKNTSPYKKIWLPIKSSIYIDEILKNNIKFGVGQINLKNNTFTTTIKVPTEKRPDYEPETSVGIDRGINNIAVMVALDKDNKFVTSKFFNGDEARHLRNRFNNYRKEVSSVGRLDLLKKSKDRESNWMEYTNHNVSRKIVDMVSELKNPIIRLEELNNFNPKLKWNYYQLQQMIEYKAKIKGIKVEYVNPKYTSQTCPKCDNIDSKNRKKGTVEFKCVNCEYQNNADFVGAWNIGKTKKINGCVRPL